MKLDKEPKDKRSTRRKQARWVLFQAQVPYMCNKCKGIPYEIPKDVPKVCWRSLANAENPIIGSLQANHKNKDLDDLDLVNLEWLCPSCHKIADSETPPGVSPKGEDEHGYFF